MNRKDILRRLIDEHDGGNQAEFAKRIGVSPSQLNQWLSGHCKLGDAGARRIELALRLPQGYFDRADNVIHMQAAEPDNGTLDQIIALARSLSPEGRYVALGALLTLAQQYPAAKPNHSS